MQAELLAALVQLLADPCLVAARLQRCPSRDEATRVIRKAEGK
jgi:hypothetical protein